MKSPSDPGKATMSRNLAGPRALGAVMPAVTRPAFQKHAPAAAQLLADWPLIVGPALAAASEPQRFAAGTLTLGCAGPTALELQHLAGALIERINTYLGRALVQRLRFVQIALPHRSATRPASAANPRQPDPASIPGLPDSPLRDALAALGAAVPLDRA